MFGDHVYEASPAPGGGAAIARHGGASPVAPRPCTRPARALTRRLGAVSGRPDRAPGDGTPATSHR